MNEAQRLQMNLFFIASYFKAVRFEHLKDDSCRITMASCREANEVEAFLVQKGYAVFRENAACLVIGGRVYVFTEQEQNHLYFVKFLIEHGRMSEWTTLDSEDELKISSEQSSTRGG